MADRPYTVLSCAMSLDGYLDGGTQTRLALSNDEDLDRVDALRAASDAILVGAATVRNDDPRLLVRSAARRAERVARGLSPSPSKVTVTRSGRLDPRSPFFTAGDSERLVYCPTTVQPQVHDALGHAALVVGVGSDVLEVADVSENLSDRGVERLLVEGGGAVHTQFLTGDLADELQLVVAPCFVGDARASRFVGDGDYPWTVTRRAPLADVRRIGDVVLLRYALSPRFETT